MREVAGGEGAGGAAWRAASGTATVHSRGEEAPPGGGVSASSHVTTAAHLHPPEWGGRPLGGATWCSPKSTADQ